VHVKNLTESSVLQQVVAPSTAVQFVSDWVQSPEGGYIIYVDNSSTGVDLMRVPMFGDRKPLPLVHTAADETSGVASPDGKLLAYVANESGRSEVYLRAMNGTVRKQVSTGGGVSPRWRRDGKELYYVATWSTMTFGATPLDARLMAVSVSADGAPGIPVPLFNIRAGGSQYDTKDGKRFLVNFEDVSSALPITVDLDWTRQLRR
jgi:dipeptidyl aminopeptidase/acylaminoacyl peptidase